MRNILLFLTCLLPLFPKARILTFHCNAPEFLEMQVKLFSKFLEDEYELFVFNDGSEGEQAESIEKMCEKYGVRCIRYEQKWHEDHPLNTYLSEKLKKEGVKSHVMFGGNNPNEVSHNLSVRHSHVIEYAMQNYGYDHDDIVLLLDGDAFPVRPFCIRDLLKTHSIAGARYHVWEDRVDYLWVVFTAFYPQKLPNVRELKFHPDLIYDRIYDTGASTWHYQQKYSYLPVHKEDPSPSYQLKDFTDGDLLGKGFSPHEIRLIREMPWPHTVEFFFNQKLMHFGASSFGLETKPEKVRVVKEYINQILDENVTGGIWGLKEIDL